MTACNTFAARPIEELPMRILSVVPVAVCCLLPSLGLGGDFQPDPRTVQRHGKGYRYPQAGWIVLHVEGEPYERGYQHGKLLAPEILGYLRCYASVQGHKAPTEAWKQVRTLANALFLRRYHREYLEEMKGIADGAAAAGAKFDDRAIDLIDIVALNAWAELDTLDNALESLPTGLEGIRFPKEPAQEKSKPKPMRCSAFAANGPATKDGKIVFGHITMFSLYPSNFFNVWLDVKPAKGRRVVMQSYPGGVQSGMDYYMNDAGLLVSETTIGQTSFDAKGMALASRIRRAVQYADNIDDAVAILKEGNNGLYTNEWLLADTKTNEIAMFELGTRKSKLWRSGKDEWFGGTTGFYWGCNNTKDLEVRLETIASVEERPAALAFRPSDRDKMWLKLYDRHKGKIDADFGKLAFTTAPLAAHPSLDAKFTTTEMAKELKTWALFGPPLGRTWEPTSEERDNHLEIRPLVSNPWTILHAGAPAQNKVEGPSPEDLPGTLKPVTPLTKETLTIKQKPQTKPAWYGTIFPKTDADVWLATGFANYERIVALDKSQRKEIDRHSEDDCDKVALALFPYRAEYELGSRAGGDVALSKIRSDLRRDEWYRIASGKGVLLLHTLREKIGAETFDEVMTRFGKENAGKRVSTADFRAFVEKATSKELGEFFESWLDRTGLPKAVWDRSGPFGVTTFLAELEDTLIVYGTADEARTNREAARALQKAIREHHSNFTVPMKADREVTAEETKKKHLLLIGRPDCNRVVERMKTPFPVTFGSRSFAVGEDVYAHTGSAVIAAAPNPDNPRFSAVVLAGVEAYATWQAAPLLPEFQPAEVVVLPHGGDPKLLTRPAKPSKGEPRNPSDNRKSLPVR
jgi:hypothetical protein